MWLIGLRAGMTERQLLLSNDSLQYSEKRSPQFGYSADIGLSPGLLPNVVRDDYQLVWRAATL